MEKIKKKIEQLLVKLISEIERVKNVPEDEHKDYGDYINNVNIDDFNQQQLTKILYSLMSNITYNNTVVGDDRESIKNYGLQKILEILRTRVKSQLEKLGQKRQESFENLLDLDSEDTNLILKLNEIIPNFESFHNFSKFFDSK